MQDEEQEWDPAAAEFMAQRLGTIHTEAGNTPVWSGKRHGNGYDDDTGSERSLILLNNKGIYSEGLFLNLDRTRGGVPVAAEIMSGLAQVGGQELNPDSAEFMAQRLGIIQTEAGNATVGSGEGHGYRDGNDAGYEISLLPLYDKGIYAEGLFLKLDQPRSGVPIAA